MTDAVESASNRLGCGAMGLTASYTCAVADLAGSFRDDAGFPALAQVTAIPRRRSQFSAALFVTGQFMITVHIGW